MEEKGEKLEMGDEFEDQGERKGEIRVLGGVEAIGKEKMFEFGEHCRV